MHFSGCLLFDGDDNLDNLQGVGDDDDDFFLNMDKTNILLVYKILNTEYFTSLIFAELLSLISLAFNIHLSASPRVRYKRKFSAPRGQSLWLAPFHKSNFNRNT